MIQLHKKFTNESIIDAISNGSEVQEYWNWKNIVFQEFQTGKAEPRILLFEIEELQARQNSPPNELRERSPSNRNLSILHCQKVDPTGNNLCIRKSIASNRSSIHSESEFNDRLNIVYQMQQNFEKLSSIIKVQTEDYWSVCDGILKGNNLMFLSSNFQLDQISKLKLLPDRVKKSDFCQLKFVYEKEPVRIGLPIQQVFEKFSVHLAWFTAILTQKVIKGGLYHTDSLSQVQSTFIKKEGMNGNFSGMVYKKSQYLGVWRQRLFAIKDNAIRFYSIEDGEETFTIEGSDIKYIWTRFEIYKNCLIIKIKHNLRKTELAFPIPDIVEGKFDWLVQIYNLMMKFQK